MIGRDPIVYGRSQVRPVPVKSQRGKPRILRGLLFVLECLFLRFNRFPFRPPLQRLINAGLHFRLWRLKEAQRIGKFDFLPRVEIQELAQTEYRSIPVVFGLDQTLLFVLEFDVGPQRVNPRSHAFLLQIGRLIV